MLKILENYDQRNDGMIFRKNRREYFFLRSFFIHNLLFLIAILFLFSCQQPPTPSLKFQGYIEGRFTYVSPNVSGVLQEIYVNRGDKVKEGDKLFFLEEQPEGHQYLEVQAKLEQAVALRDKIKSELEEAKLNLSRQNKLLQANATTQQAYDSARIAVDKTKAQLSSEEANIKSLQEQLSKNKWNVEKKLVYAAKPAVVHDIYHLTGEYIALGKPVLALIASEDISIVFFIPQGDLSKIKLGQTIVISCDQCPKTYSAKISFISSKAEYTPPVIYSEVERAKLVFRVEAKLENKEVNLHAGQPVEVSVNEKQN